MYPQEQVAKVLGVDHNRIVVRTKRMGEFVRDWSECVTGSNMPQLKLGC